MSFDHDSSSSRSDTNTTPDTEAIRRYEVTLTNTSLSLTINITSILSWINTELDAYIKRGKLSTIQDLVVDSEDGRAFLCLAQRFYSTFVPQATFDTLMDQDTTATQTRSEFAFSVFEKELGIAPPTATVPAATQYPIYIARVRQALISLDSIASGNQDPWTQRTQEVLHIIQHTRQQLQALGFHSTSLPSRDDDGSLKTHDPISSVAHSTSDMHDYLDKNGANSNCDGRSKTTNGWEDDLDMMEQALLNLNGVKADYYSWIDDNMDSGSPSLPEKDRRLALVQSVNDAYTSLQMYLDQDQQALTVYRKRALFTQATAPIRQDLDWVQAEMLKTTTTDTGIKELEEHLGHAGTLLQQLIDQYRDTAVNTAGIDQEQHQTPYPEELGALVKRYQLVQSWVEDVRIWFVEAQRIRHWIGERIDLLENSTIPNGATTEDISMTADQVEDHNTNHEAMEKEVELFNKQDMSRLRTHVKDLTVDSTKEKDLSPADTTTIEITFTTLMALDRLLHLLKKHSHRLQVLTLRVFWENEFAKAVNWVNTQAHELTLFIQSQARWQSGIDNNDSISTSPPDLKSVVIDTLLQMELDISRFDQGQFTTTVNLYQEMDDASEIELPQFLESRQVALEEQFESLVHRVSFARRVVEQYLTMIDFMDSTGDLIQRRGHGLSEKLEHQTEKMYSSDSDQQLAHNDDDPNALDMWSLVEKQLVDENSHFQEEAVRLITDTAGLIPYTETSSLLDYEENEIGNNRVKLAIKSRSSELILLGETLERKLDQFKEALSWYIELTSIQSDLQHTQGLLNQSIRSASHLMDQLEETFGEQASQLSDELIQSRNVTGSWDHQQHQISDTIGTNQRELEVISGRIDGLLEFQQSSTLTLTSKNAMSDTIDHLGKAVKDTASRLQSLASTLDQCASKLSMAKDRQSWEYHFSVASRWITTHEQKCQRTRFESIWSPTTSLDSAESDWMTRCDTVTNLEQELNVFKGGPLASLVNAFEKLVDYGDRFVNSANENVKWEAQRQRQATLLSQAEHTTNTLLLTNALLSQWKAITRYLAGNEDIRSQGVQWLNHLKWITLHRDLDETAPPIDKPRLSLDSYKETVETLWIQWQSSSDGGFTMSPMDSHGDLALMTDWQQQCDFLEKQASDQYNALRSLGSTLAQWMSVADESKNVHGDIRIWRDKVYSLDARAIELLETLTVKKDELLERFTTIPGGDKPQDATVESLDLAMGRFKDMDVMLKQWLDQDFCALRDNGSKLNGQMEDLMESLMGLGGSQDYRETLGFDMTMNTTQNYLDQLEEKCRTKVKPLLSILCDLVKTCNLQTTWESAWMNLSLVTEGLQEQLKNLDMDKDGWIKAGICTDSFANIQDISKNATALVLELDNASNTNDWQHLLDSENTAYTNMELSYQNLSRHSLSDSPVELSSTFLTKHTDCQQSISYLISRAKQLGEVVKWLETGTSWLLQADGQLEKWDCVMADLDTFTQHEAKWSMDIGPKVDLNNDVLNGGESHQVLNLNSTLSELEKGVNNLVVNMDTIVDALNDWKAYVPAQDLKLVGPANKDGFDPWQEKVSDLEMNRNHANDLLLYAVDLIDHHKVLLQWYDKVIELEHYGEKVKSALLLADGDMGSDGESSMRLEHFDHKLAEILCSDQNMDYPDRPLLPKRASATQSSSSITDVDIHNDNAALRQYIQSRHEYLEKLSVSLHSILNAKERSTRLKALADEYVDNATESLQWIKHTYDNLQHEMTITDSDANELATIELKLGVLHELETATHLHANGHYSGLKESANHCVAAFESESDDFRHNSAQQLDKVIVLQQQLDNERQQLRDSLRFHKLSLDHAERVYWSNQVIKKCKVIDDQLNDFGTLDVDTLHVDKLDLWQRDLNDIKSDKLERLQQLFALDDGNGLDHKVDRGLLDDATNMYQQLDSRLATAHHDAKCGLQKLQYTKMAAKLLTSMDDMKSTLADWSSGTRFLSVDSRLVDEAYYNDFRVFRNSLLDDWHAIERLYDQERDLFIPMGYNGVTEGINERHQEASTGFVELQQEITIMNGCYHLLTRRRPYFDRLHQISSLLDNIDVTLCGIDEFNEDDIYAVLKQIDRVRGMIADSSCSFKQLPDESSPHYTNDKCDQYNTTLNDIYQRHFLVISEHLATIERQLDIQQKRQHARRSYQQFKQRAEEIKALAQKESSSLASLLSHEANLSGYPLDTQQYHAWTKSVTSSEKILQDLLHETKVLVDSVAEIIDIQQNDADNISAMCQLPLDDLNNNLKHQRNLLNLMRQVIGYAKSAEDIGSWLENFCRAVDDVTTDVTTADDDSSDGSTQELENDINDFKIKLSGSEPAMASLESMNKAIQGTNILEDDKDNENHVATIWKRLAYQQHEKILTQWKESADALEKSALIRDQALRARTLARKIRSMTTIAKESRRQIEQLQNSLIDIVKVTAKGDKDHDQENQADLFELVPRELRLSQLQQKVESFENGLMVQGQDTRVEINRLIHQYYDYQQGNSNDDQTTFIQQQEDIDTTWSKIMESIEDIKDTLCTEKSMAKCISMMDDIDVLLDSMDEVVTKAAPQYNAITVDDKFSKAELEAKQIELDARGNYYKQNIKQSLQQLDEAWMEISSNINDNNRILSNLSNILEGHRVAQHIRYGKLFDQEIPARQLELVNALKLHLVDETKKMSRLRKTSLPTRKAVGTLIPIPRSVLSTGLSRPPQTTSTGLHPSSALQGRQRLRTVSSSSSLTGDSQLPRPHKSTSSSTKTPKSVSSTSVVRKKSARKPNDYVAQTGNDLDVEIGRIVNDMPYRVQVKMVPGEIGRYWFGDINPKLVYCRVLKSKMVMVRVGGGWSELSQFLRDHAKLEGELIIPKQQDQHLLHTTMQEGYLETTTSLQRQRKQLMKQQIVQPQEPQLQKASISSTLLPATRSTSVSSSIPIMKSSRSTSNSTVSHQGYKDGDIFVAVDRYGNPLEVKLSKFKQKSALPTSTTNRRRKAVKP